MTGHCPRRVVREVKDGFIPHSQLHLKAKAKAAGL